MEYTLLLNTASPLISKLTALVAEGAPEDASGKAELIAEQIWRLSVLALRGSPLPLTLLHVGIT